MRENEIERFEHAGRTVVICRDEMAENPRKDFADSNIATLTCCHRRYDLGDERHSEPMSVKDIVRKVRGDGDKVLAILPLYLYDHSGITMRTERFSDQWDSGQVGWAYVTKSKAEKVGEPGDKTHFEAIIRQEVATYDNYITGSVYGYVVLDQDDDVLESCWGFFDRLDYVRKEAREAAEHARDKGQVDGKCEATCEGGVST